MALICLTRYGGYSYYAYPHHAEAPFVRRVVCYKEPLIRECGAKWLG